MDWPSGESIPDWVGLRWAQVLGLPHCCLAVASQNLGSEEAESCEQMLSPIHYALGGYLEESAPRHSEDAASANHSYTFAMVLSQLA
jgi:hypothetical protein